MTSRYSLNQQAARTIYITLEDARTGTAYFLVDPLIMYVAFI
ncbi:hypothetical protein [Nostoc sp. NMS1]|nr:hypothetical protein [Nostoc sp. NMS1]